MINFLFVFNGWALLLVRIILGLILLVHGWPKIKNLSETAKNFEGMGFKPGKFWGTVVALIEVVGGIFLIAGLFTQVVASLLAIQFLVILLTLKRNKGFGDIEFDLLIFATAVLLATSGAGSYSLDSLLNLFLY